MTSDVPTSWGAARAVGASHYRTGKPCKRGHVALRHARSGQCLECMRERVAAKYRDDPSAGRARSAAYRRSNPDKVRAALQAWESRNREHRAAYDRARYAAPDSKRRATVLDRKARRRRATPGWFGEFDELVVQEAAAVAALRREATGIQWEVDHSIPLRSAWASGLHCGANLQVIPARLNKLKSNLPQFNEPLAWLATL